MSIDGRVVSLTPAACDDDPSPIGTGMPQALYDATRIIEPMVRRGWLEDGPRRGATGRGSEPFVAVPWDTALDLAAQELDRVRSTYGNAAIYGGSYGWASAGRFHHALSQIHRFLTQAGGYTASENGYSFAAMEVILPHVIGGAPFSILERGPVWEEIEQAGRLVVSFGGLHPKNAQVNGGGLGRHENVGWQRRCRDAGVRFVNVSPVADDALAELDAEWLPIRPNTDVALMLALAHVIVTEDRHDRDFLERCCVGFDRFAAYLVGEQDGVAKDPVWAAEITELDPATIRDLARRIATQRTVINATWSTQRCDHGEQSPWAAVALAAVSGSMGLPGGGFAGGLGIVQVGVRPARAKIAALPQGRNPIASSIPVARVADMLLHPGASYDYDGQRHTYPDIRLVYWAGGNPFHHHQDLNRLVRAWREPETVISHDSWWNPLARFSDIVFPVATSLERNDFACGSLDLTLTAMQSAAEPPGGVPTDYAVFSALAERLGFGDTFTEGRSAEEWVRELYERTRTDLAEREAVDLPPFDEFWALGSVETPPPTPSPSGTFPALRADPQAYPLATPSGRIELFSATIDGFSYDDCPGHPCWMEPYEWLGSPVAERFPLHLISRQPSTRLHSQYDNGSVSRASKVAGREPMLINPDDARARGIADGDVVRVHNDRGACLVGAQLSDGVRPGVVVLATGAWYDPVEPGVPGSLDRHGNPNVLTADRGSSRLAQGPTSGTTLVEAERVDPDQAPAARPFEPPIVLRLSPAPGSAGSRRR